MNQYEAMFVFDPTFGAAFESCEAEIRRIMERAHAEVLICRKWDERRLAFRIKGRKRGVYILTYFKAPADSIGPLERDAKLSEHVLRVLVLRADGVTPEAMEQAFVIRKEEPRGDEYDDAGRGRRDDRDDRGDRGDRGDRRPRRPRDRMEEPAMAGEDGPSDD